MKKYLKNTFVRAILLLIIFVFVAQLLLALADYLIAVSQPSDVVMITGNQVANLGQIEIVSTGSMSGEKMSLSHDLTTPSPLLLPLKTLSDFTNAPVASSASIITNKGELKVELFPELAPVTVANWLTLADQNFYQQLKIHRHEPNFVVQMGDPLSRHASSEAALLKLGQGYPGYRIIDEFSREKSFAQVGALGMAHINLAGKYPHTGGSQFFITLAPAPELDGQYTLFGQVTDGLNVLANLTIGDTIEQITYEER